MILAQGYGILSNEHYCWKLMCIFRPWKSIKKTVYWIIEHAILWIFSKFNVDWFYKCRTKFCLRVYFVIFHVLAENFDSLLRIASNLGSIHSPYVLKNRHYGKYRAIFYSYLWWTFDSSLLKIAGDFCFHKNSLAYLFEYLYIFLFFFLSFVKQPLTSLS